VGDALIENEEGKEQIRENKIKKEIKEKEKVASVGCTPGTTWGDHAILMSSLPPHVVPTWQ
jgi:hypothetical protein